MALLHNNIFVCIDCETTGLDPETDSIIEVAAVTFTFGKEIARFHSLVDPRCIIPESSIEIHNITQDMVAGQPTIDKVLPTLFNFIEDYIIVGHGINFDISIINAQAKSKGVATTPIANTIIDTLRLARSYGESPNNSLSMLRQHFHIPDLGSHRALNDVLITIDVFKQLCKKYRTLNDIFSILSKPIPMRRMPLGKYKGRPFGDIPGHYLKWSANQNFDQDLLYSIRRELSRRKKGGTFSQVTNPFSTL